MTNTESGMGNTILDLFLDKIRKKECRVFGGGKGMTHNNSFVAVRLHVGHV